MASLALPVQGTDQDTLTTWEQQRSCACLLADITTAGMVGTAGPVIAYLALL